MHKCYRPIGRCNAGQGTHLRKPASESCSRGGATGSSFLLTFLALVRGIGLLDESAVVRRAWPTCTRAAPPRFPRLRSTAVAQQPHGDRSHADWRTVAVTRARRSSTVSGSVTEPPPADTINLRQLFVKPAYEREGWTPTGNAHEDSPFSLPMVEYARGVLNPTTLGRTTTLEHHRPYRLSTSPERDRTAGCTR